MRQGERLRGLRQGLLHGLFGAVVCLFSVRVVAAHDVPGGPVWRPLPHRSAYGVVYPGWPGPGVYRPYPGWPGEWIWGWGWGFPYPYPPPVVWTPPPAYVERPAAPPPGYWYWCDQPQGWFPAVRACLVGWQAVPPRSSTAGAREE